MYLGIDPPDAEDGGHIALKDRERLQAEAMLNESKGLEQDVVGAQECRAPAQETLPDLPGCGMVGVIRIEYGQDGGRIDEDRHSP
jgi:hypothetical protein